MNFKKSLALLVISCMTVVTAACGQQAKDTSSEPSDTSGKPVELTFWHSMDGVYSEILQKQVDQFNNTIGTDKNIKVTPVFQAFPGTSSLTAAMASDDIKNMPDVIQIYGENVSLLRDYKRTVWVEDYITSADATVKKDNLIPNAVSSFSIDGKLLGAPYNMSALMLYYNKTYLKEAGYENPPLTIAQMAEMLPNLTTKTDAKFGLNVRVNQFELENWIATQGTNGTYFGNNESGHTGYMNEFTSAKDDSLKKYLNEWKKVVDSGAYKATRDSINEEFAAGMHAMVIMNGSRIPTISNLVDDQFEWDVAPIPTVSSTDIGGAFPSGSGLFMLDRDDEAKKAASWLFIQHMLSAETQTMWLEGTGYVPVNIQSTELEEYKRFIASDPKSAAPYKVLMQSKPNIIAAFVPNPEEVNDVIKNAMLQFGEGSADVEATYRAITGGIEKAFADYYRANPIN
ncbi:extracellular solute-binding protein [Paenibacillus sp. L3-i20]|uniref:extracellular solute-binding protein n=1 Tax=Paenibacillus sp. L3-i20 TaxID=2905833 RepID=UPI001EDE03CB|nr:extracellular solute-binding protein [Paenibacillus sp. L3-i20]GKU78053.1 ABC transporter substrate-binding protein [Paenibacillus sp. L3-i20]